MRLVRESLPVVLGGSLDIVLLFGVSLGNTRLLTGDVTTIKVVLPSYRLGAETQSEKLNVRGTGSQYYSQ